MGMRPSLTQGNRHQSRVLSESEQGKKMAVVYLTQRKHSSYNRPGNSDSLAQTANSLRKLYENVMGWSRADVLILHNGDLNADDFKVTEASLLGSTMMLP